MVAPSQPNVHKKQGVPELLSTKMYLFSIVFYLGLLSLFCMLVGEGEK